MRLTGLKIVYLIGEGFEELEFFVPMMRLQEEGADVVVAGIKGDEIYRGKNGLSARSDTSVAALNADDFDGIVIPGGWAPDKIRRYDEVKKLTHNLYQDGKTVAMICHAGLVGISAGIVKGHQSIGSEGIKDDLINAGATWRDESAFRSGNIVWGRVVADIPDFCRELVTALEEQKNKS
jgi:protease I